MASGAGASKAHAACDPRDNVDRAAISASAYIHINRLLYPKWNGEKGMLSVQYVGGKIEQ